MLHLLEMDPKQHTRLVCLSSLTRKGLENAEEKRQLTLRGLALRNTNITFDGLIVGQDLRSAETALWMNGVVGRLNIPIITCPDLTELTTRPVPKIELRKILEQVPKGMELEEFLYGATEFRETMWSLGMNAGAAITAQFSQFPPGSTLLVVCHRGRLDAAMLHLRGMTELSDMAKTPLLTPGHLAEMIVDHVHKDVVAYQLLTDAT